MTYIRRIAAVVLSIVFFVALLASLALVTLNATLMDPHYYPGRLETGGVYRFVMVDVLTSAIDEVRRLDGGQFGGNFRENPIVTSGLSTRQIAEAVHRAVSPRDLERMAAPAVLQIAEYATAERDRVALNAHMVEPVTRTADEVHKLMRDSGAYALFIEHELEPRVREAAGEMLRADGDVSVWMLYLFGSAEHAEDRMVRVVMRTLTAEWLAGQVEQAMGDFTAYLVGETDGFEISVHLTDAEIATAVEETKAVLREADAYELVYPGVVEPVLADVLGSTVRLPYGVSVTRDEVMGALRKAAPPSWVQRQAENLIDYVGPYVVGRSDGFSTEIDLSRNKRKAAAALAEVAVGRVGEALSTLPFCATRAEATVAQRRLGQALPRCIPAGVSAGEILKRAEKSIAQSIQTFVFTPIPDSITFTESQFRSALEQSGGRETLERLDYLRSVMSEGWTYNQDDLRAELSEKGDTLQVLDGVRSFLADGYSREYQVPTAEDSGDGFGADLDRARELSEAVRRYQWAAYVLTPLLLVVIVLLGETSWRGRVMWASSVLLVSAGSVFVLSWPVQNALMDTVAEQVLEEVSDGHFGGTQRLVAAKLIEVAGGIVDEFIGDVRLYSLVLAGVAAVVLLAGMFWDRAVEVAGRVQRGR